MSDKLRPTRSTNGSSLNFPSFFSRNPKAAQEKPLVTKSGEVGSEGGIEPGLGLNADAANKKFNATDVDVLLASPLFDAQWYQSQSKALETCASRRALVEHYLRVGAAKDLDPHPLFDTRYYKQNAPDIADANPLIHFLLCGGKEGNRPHVEFDSPWYQRSYTDVKEAGVNPLVHYLTSGAREGRWPSADFDCIWYQTTYLNARAPIDPAHAEMTALEHFVRFGKQNHLARNKEEYRHSLITDATFASVKRAHEEHPLPFYSSNPVVKRVNFITDRLGQRTAGVCVDVDVYVEVNVEVGVEAASISALVDYGHSDRDVITLASILAAKLATLYGASLRVVTRKEECSNNLWAKLLSAYQAQMPPKVEFRFCDYLSNSEELPISDQDIFIVEGRHNLLSVRASVPENRLIYVKLSGEEISGESQSETDGLDESPASLRSQQLLESVLVLVLASADTTFANENAPALKDSRRVCESVFV